MAQIRRRPRRTQQERRTETRRRLIDAAIQLLLEAGFARFTIGEVASRARVTTGAVQHHFATRQDLLLGVFEAFFPRRHIEIFSPEMMKLSVAERIDQMVDLYWKYIYGRSDYLAIWELVTGTRAHPEMRQRMRSAQKEIVAMAVADLAKVFADINVSSAAIFDVWTFIASQLRGLALLSLFEDPSVLKKGLALLKEAIVHMITRKYPVTPAA